MEPMLSSQKSTSLSSGNGVDMATLKELKAEAKAAGLTGYANWNKAKLEAELDKATYAPTVVEGPATSSDADEQAAMIAEREERRQARRDEEALAAANRANDQAAAKKKADAEFKQSRLHGNLHE